MSVVKRAVMLLTLAAFGTNAAPGPDCDGLNITLAAEDLHQIYGDWVLVWSVSDDPESMELLKNLTSSIVELRLLPDNNTVSYNERNLFRGESCHRYFNNMTISSGPSHSDQHPSLTIMGTLEKNGGVTKVNVTAEVFVFKSCSNCLMMDYRGSVGHFLLSYRRAGHHQDVDQLKTAHGDHQKLAECVGLPHHTPYIYNGTTDFCQKKSSAETSGETS